MRADPIRSLARPALTFSAAFLFAFLVFRSSDAVCTVVRAPIEPGDMPRRLLTAEMPAALLILVTALSAFTRFCRPVLIAGCVWRGASLGCLSAFLSGGRLSGVPLVRTLVFASLSALVYLRIAAEADAAHPDLIAGSGPRGYIRIMLILAGANFLCDAALMLS